jgi:hypothetical protein
VQFKGANISVARRRALPAESTYSVCVVRRERERERERESTSSSPPPAPHNLETCCRSHAHTHTRHLKIRTRPKIRQPLTAGLAKLIFRLYALCGIKLWLTTNWIWRRGVACVTCERTISSEDSFSVQGCYDRNPHLRINGISEKLNLFAQQRLLTATNGATTSKG